MNKISFIIEFDEVSKTQEEQLTEFIEKTGIKFHVLKNDNYLKKYEKYKKVINKAIKFIDNYMYENYCYVGSEDRLKDILKEVSE